MTAQPRLPESGVHHIDCRWACKYEPHAPDYRNVCPRTDHAYCETCAKAAKERGVRYDPN